MRLNRVDYVTRERQKLAGSRSEIKKIRDSLDGSSMTDVLWLRNRLTAVVQELNMRIAALDQEIADNEAEEKERKARARA